MSEMCGHPLYQSHERSEQEDTIILHFTDEN